MNMNHDNNSNYSSNASSIPGRHRRGARVAAGAHSARRRERRDRGRPVAARSNNGVLHVNHYIDNNNNSLAQSSIERNGALRVTVGADNARRRARWRATHDRSCAEYNVCDSGRQTADKNGTNRCISNCLLWATRVQIRASMDTREKDYMWLRTEGDYTAQCCTRLREAQGRPWGAGEGGKRFLTCL